jgi:uncharacterized protein YjiS (DUF1127 family)
MLAIPRGAALASPALALKGGALQRLITEAVQSFSHGTERRRQLRALAELDDHLLRDIGVCREDVRRACSRSFWIL